MALLAISALTLANCNNSDKTFNKKTTTDMEIKAKNRTTELSCKLTTPELHERKETVLESLKNKITAKEELENGYALKFPGSDRILDELTEFVKTERACCEFFVFGLSISGDKSEIWLELTGPVGAKDLISTELEL